MWLYKDKRPQSEKVRRGTACWQICEWNIPRKESALEGSLRSVGGAAPGGSGLQCSVGMVVSDNPYTKIPLHFCVCAVYKTLIYNGLGNDSPDKSSCILCTFNKAEELFPPVPRNCQSVKWTWDSINKLNKCHFSCRVTGLRCKWLNFAMMELALVSEYPEVATVEL